MDLIRKILLHIEDKDSKPANIERYEESIINGHLKLLVEAGLIQGKLIETGLALQVRDILNPRLTWQGHEFIDAARNETLWNKTKTQITEKAGTVAFTVLKVMLEEGAKRLFAGFIGSPDSRGPGPGTFV